MSEIAESPQEQSKTESVLDRLSKDFPDMDEPVVEVKEPVEKEIAKIEGEKPETQEEPKKPEEPAKPEPIEEGFKEEEEPVQTDDTWRAFLEAKQIAIPEDFTEEKGIEIYEAAREAEWAAKVEEARIATQTDLFAGLEIPEPIKAEGQMIVDLMKTGMSLEEIYAPISQIKEWKAMPKEQLIRQKYEAMPEWTPEMVDHRMQQIETDKTLDIEYQIVLTTVNQLEKNITAQRQAQIQDYQTRQTQVKEQNRQKELSSVKAALDKVPTFMDRKLSDENKQAVLRDISTGVFENATAQDKAEFMLWKRYGKQGLKDLQARALEKATLEKAKSQHNIPSTGQGGNRPEATTTHKTGIDRVENDPAFAAK